MRVKPESDSPIGASQRIADSDKVLRGNERGEHGVKNSSSSLCTISLQSRVGFGRTKNLFQSSLDEIAPIRYISLASPTRYIDVRLIQLPYE
jgi:hypothetical protein